MKPDMQFPAAGIVEAVRVALGGREPLRVDATQLATALLGDAIATNLFMLGYAWQQGLVPLSLDSILRAVQLNGAAVEMNTQAFNWGRLAAVDIQAVTEAAGLSKPTAEVTALTPAPLDDLRLSANLEQLIERRVAFLTDYQDAAYAAKYRALVDSVRAEEAKRAPGSTKLTEAVARYYFKLMAYKDEYEVARLYTSGDFLKRVASQFEGDYRLHFNLAPPLFAKRDENGKLMKAEYGPWMLKAFGLLKHFKGLRGSKLDIFGYTEERRTERALIEEYRGTIERLLGELSADKLDLAVEIARVPERIRGFGHVKEAHLEQAKKLREELLTRWQQPVAAEA
jgi:indolepyruvate ferredoxin oxidoreductase